MSKTALVIGGTGPTGPFVVEGLAARDYTVTILHGGQHELDFAVDGVRHIHTDPHFKETLEEGLGKENFDLVVAQYGRLKVTAEVLRGRTERLVAAGGATAIYAGEADERWGQMGKPALFPETEPILATEGGANVEAKIGRRMVEAMDALFEGHRAGHYSATYIGYPLNYGPRNPGAYDWAIVKRLLDGRRQIVVADGGVKLESRVLSQNAADSVLLVVDQPDRSAGKRYSVSDRYTYTMRQRIEFVARHMGVEVELVDMPYQFAWPCHPYWRNVRGHRLCDSSLIRHDLGYVDKVEASDGYAGYIDWLLANQPEPGGEAERQIGDPFDYESEDALIESWAEVEGKLDVSRPSDMPVAGHQYRHPKAPGEAWRPKGSG